MQRAANIPKEAHFSHIGFMLRAREVRQMLLAQKIKLRNAAENWPFIHNAAVSYAHAQRVG